METNEGNSIGVYAELFEKVLARPAMYVGSCSIVRIGAFMGGYWYAKLEAGEDSEDDLYKGFNQWVARRFKITSAHD